MMDEFDVPALKKAHKDARRKDQYARQAAKRHKIREGIQRYKELHPELYAELQAQVQLDLEIELELEKEGSSTQMPTIVFTGELSITRAQASQLAEKAGFKVNNNVSKNTTYVVVGENPGSKLHRATQLDTEILDEEQFNLLLQGKKPSHTKAAVCRHCGYKLPEQTARFARISGGFTCPQCHTQNRF